MKQILTAAALAVVPALMLVAPAAAQTFPPQHWASAGGVVEVLPNRAHDYTLQQLNDIEGIRETFYHWAMYYDEGRSDLLPTILTEDVEVTVLLGSTEPIGVFNGVPAVAAYNDSSLAGQLDQRRHVFSNIIVDNLTDTTATASAFGIVVKVADGLSIGAMVLYTAQLEKGDDGIWRYSHFTIAIDDYAGNLAQPAE